MFVRPCLLTITISNNRETRTRLRVTFSTTPLRNCYSSLHITAVEQLRIVRGHSDVIFLFTFAEGLLIDRTVFTSRKFNNECRLSESVSRKPNVTH